MIEKKFFLSFVLMVTLCLISCANQFKFGSEPISKPEEYKHVYEAKEKYVLRAIAAVLKEKEIGNNVVIDQRNHRVDSDYVVSGDWRTKTTARVKQLTWKECEVTLIVTTEKKTKTGWEMQRLLGKDQYESFFSVIDLKIYEEMSKID